MGLGGRGGALFELFALEHQVARPPVLFWFKLSMRQRFGGRVVDVVVLATVVLFRPNTLASGRLAYPETFLCNKPLFAALSLALLVGLVERHHHPFQVFKHFAEQIRRTSQVRIVRVGQEDGGKITRRQANVDR